MKKILSLFLTFTMMCSIVLSLGACRKENNDDNNKNHGDTNNNQNNQEDKSYLASILAAEDEKFKLIETNLEKIGYYGIATDDYEDIVNELNSKKENQEVVSLNSADNKYTVYVDKCLGKAYYQNNETGYVLSSMRENDKSQVEVKYSSIYAPDEILDMCDTHYAAIRGNSSVLQKENSIVVNFTLDNEDIKFLLPERITAKKLESELLVPMFNEFRDLMVKYCNNVVENDMFDIFKAEKYNPKNESLVYSVYYKGALNIHGVHRYLDDMISIIDSEYNIVNGNLGSEGYIELDKMVWNIMDIYGSGTNGYRLRNLNFYSKDSNGYEALMEEYYSDEGSEISKTLEPIYEFTGTTTPIQLNATRLFAKYMSKYRTSSEQPEYTKDEMLLDEAYCGVYFDKNAHKQTLKFECSIEYSFDVNGNLCVVFHDNTKEEDKSKYVVNDVVLLPNFYGEFAIDKPKFTTDGTVTVVTMKKAETE